MEILGSTLEAQALPLVLQLRTPWNLSIPSRISLLGRPTFEATHAERSHRRVKEHLYSPRRWCRAYLQEDLTRETGSPTIAVAQDLTRRPPRK